MFLPARLIVPPLEPTKTLLLSVVFADPGWVRPPPLKVSVPLLSALLFPTEIQPDESVVPPV